MKMDWSKAECKGTPIEMWYPGKGESMVELEKICSTCHVQKPCLEEALSVDIAYDKGYRGGYSERGRRKLRNQRPKKRSA